MHTPAAEYRELIGRLAAGEHVPEEEVRETRTLAGVTGRDMRREVYALQARQAAAAELEATTDREHMLCLIQQLVATADPRIGEELRMIGLRCAELRAQYVCCLEEGREQEGQILLGKIQVLQERRDELIEAQLKP